MVRNCRQTSPWTDEKIGRLRELVDRKWTARQIADDLGCTKNSVLGKTFRLGITTGIETEEGRAVRKARAADQRRANVGGGVMKRKLKPRVDTKRQAPTVMLAAPEVVGKGIGLMELTAITCRWPINDDMTNAKFCGHDIAEGSAYCPHHRFRSSHRSDPVRTEQAAPAIRDRSGFGDLKVA
jgi:GcrA cell cycle regulator